MRIITLAATIFLALGNCLGQTTQLSPPQLPKIPDGTFTITDNGAVGDGKTMCTEAIKKTIAACEAAGGGTVEVPAGKFLTGPFALASNLNLHLADEATILISDNRKDFKPTGDGFENCITAEGCHDLEISGNGTIDGQGQTWWDEFRDSRNGPQPPHRPYMIMLTNITRLRLANVTLANSPMFHLVPRLCRDVTIDSIKIKSPADSPNTDGIDPSGWNYLITGCTIDTGDDNIALKPRPAEGGPSCQNFLIEKCTFLHGHGMSIGGGSHGDVRGMTVRDCTFQDTDAGIRLKSGRDRGGLAEDLTYENLTMKDVKTAILITSYYPTIPKNPADDPAQKITDHTPYWKHIRIENVTSENGAMAGRIVGLAEAPIEDVVLTNVHITAEKPMQIVNAKGVRFVDSQITATNGQPNQIADSEVEGLTDNGN